MPSPLGYRSKLWPAWLTAVALSCTLFAGQAIAQTQPVAMVYVVQLVEIGGVPVRVIAPVEEPGLINSGLSTRPMKAFDALRSRAPKAYGNSSLRIDSATRATLVIDQNADADLIIAEVFWTLASFGIVELLAPPAVRGTVTLQHLSYGAHVLVLTPFDLLNFAKVSEVPRMAFLMIGGQPVPAPEAAARLVKGDPLLRKPLIEAVSGSAMRPKMAVIEAVARADIRTAYKLQASDIMPALTDRSLTVRGAALDAVIQAGLKGNKPVLAALEMMVENDPDTDLKLRAVKTLSKAGVGKYNDLLQAEKLRTGTADEALKAVQVLARSKQVKIAGPALVGSLSHGDERVRDAAFKGLVDMAQFDVLFGAIDGDQLTERMRERIARVLVEKGSDQARDRSLEYLLAKGGEQGAIYAAGIYGKRGSKVSTPLLINALKHDSPMVRQAAATALAQIKDERAIVPLADGAAARRRDEEFMMAAAVEILKTLRLDQVKRLVDSKNLQVRQMAIRSLAGFAKGSRPRPDVVALLLQAMKDSNAAIKRSAVFALARIKDDGIARDLAKLLNDPDVEVRTQVAVALGNASSRYAEANDVLVVMLRDRDKNVRVTVIDAIAQRRAQKAFNQLTRLVQYPDVKIKRAVYRALLALREPSNADLLRPLFRKGMDTNDSEVRLTCIKALSDKTALSDLDALRRASFDPKVEVKKAAIAALSAAGFPEGMEVLALWFGDPDMTVRELALDALGGIDAGADWKAKKKRYIQDFINTPNQPAPLVKKAKALPN